MTWHESTDVEQYLAATADLLFHDPGRHTVALTVAENVRARPDGTRFAWYVDGGDVTGAVSQTPSYPLVLAVVPDHAIRGLVDLFAPTAVAGPTALAVQVAAVAGHGRQVTVRSAERIHRLTTLDEPMVAGEARIATKADTELLVNWVEAFLRETSAPASDARRFVAERLSWDGLLLWEDAGPVAVAGKSRHAFGMVRVGPVYTPPDRRGKGYGGAATAAISQLALLQGAYEVVLTTDLTNPTSNALYARLGFVPVVDRSVLEISSS